MYLAIRSNRSTAPGYSFGSGRQEFMIGSVLQASAWTRQARWMQSTTDYLLSAGEQHIQIIVGRGWSDRISGMEVLTCPGPGQIGTGSNSRLSERHTHAYVGPHHGE
jgi:hypothetical protein